jgi:hypothetical protein
MKKRRTLNDEAGNESRAVLFAIYRLMPFYAGLKRDTGLGDEEICEAMLELHTAGSAELIEKNGRFVWRLTDAGKYQAAVIRHNGGECR